MIDQRDERKSLGVVPVSVIGCLYDRHAIYVGSAFNTKWPDVI